MSDQLRNNGFLDPNAFLPGTALGPAPGTFGSAFGTGHTPGTRGTPLSQGSTTANPNATSLQDSNPFLANPNARPVGDPARREQRIMNARSQPQQFDPAMFKQLMQNPLFAQLLQMFMQR